MYWQSYLISAFVACVAGCMGYWTGLRNGRREGLQAAKDDDAPMPRWMMEILREEGDL